MRVLVAIAALAVLGCSGSDAASPDASLENGARTAAVPAAAPASASTALPPWKLEAQCFWLLTYPDGVAYRAWISGNRDGFFLSLVDEQMSSWPVSDELEITLTRDGDPKQSVKARGDHGDEDGASLLTIILDEPQRALLDGAREIAVSGEGRAPFVLPMTNGPTKAAIDSCDTRGAPGVFTEQ